MDLRDIHDELVAIRSDLKRYAEQNATTRADVSWLKKAVLGGFGVLASIIASLVSSKLG